MRRFEDRGQGRRGDARAGAAAAPADGTSDDQSKEAVA